MKKSSQSGFHLWIIIIIIAIIGVIGLLVWRFLDSSGINIIGKVTGGDTFGSSYNCKDRDVKFTSPPLKMEDLGYIRPLGAMLDGHVTPTDHVYVGPVDPNVPDNTYPVLMPADGTVVEVGRMPAEYIGDRDFELPPEDHRVVISFSCRYYAIFIHVHKLEGAVATAAAGLEPGANKQMSVELKAGDTIGYIGGDTFDWTPVDTESKLTGFIHPDLYKSESWKIHTVSPFDLYEGTLKTELEAKSWRTAAPIGGKIDYDQPGKLIGTWFREGTNGYQGANPERYWDGHLSVVPDYIDPTFTIVSIGNWDGKATQMLVTNSIDPAKITKSDGMVKMELSQFSYSDGSADMRGNTFTQGAKPTPMGELLGTIAFEVLDGEKLKVEKFIGKSAAQVTSFTSAAETYER